MKTKFHFVLSNELKEKIINFSSVNSKSYSASVVYVIGEMKVFLMKHFIIDNKCEIGGYCSCDADMDLNVYLEAKDYFFLKQIHSNLKTFSIALLIRWMLEKFFDGLNKYGFKKFKRMVKKYKVFFMRNVERCSVDMRDNRKISNTIKKFSLFYKYQKLQNRTKHMSSRVLDKEYIKLVISKNFNFLRLEFT